MTKEKKPIYIAADGTLFSTLEECLEHNKATKKGILADTRLYDIFKKDIESISSYIQEGRQFWLYDEKKRRHELITITYKRVNVAFYVKYGSQEEKAFFTTSIGSSLLRPRKIYVKDIANHLVKKGAYTNFDEAYNDVLRFYRDYGLYVPDGCEIDIDDLQKIQ